MQSFICFFIYFYILSRNRSLTQNYNLIISYFSNLKLQYPWNICLLILLNILKNVIIFFSLCKLMVLETDGKYITRNICVYMKRDRLCCYSFRKFQSFPLLVTGAELLYCTTVTTTIMVINGQVQWFPHKCQRSLMRQ